MFGALWLPEFRLQAALRWRELSGPIALVDGDARKGTLLEVNEAAARSWVQPGLTPAQAMGRCPDLQIVLRSPAQEAACQALLVELAMGFSPRVESTMPGLCTLDLTGAPRGACWQRMGEEMIARAVAERFHARVGIAPHPDHAWLAALRAEPVNVVYDGAPFCAALPLEVLEPSPELAEIFNDWGIRTIGEFLRLPAQDVVERLGAEAAELRRRASGRSRRVLRLERPVEQFAEAFDFDYAIEASEPLLFLLRRFVDSLAPRLRASYRVASALTLTLPLDGAPDYTRTFSIPSPTSDADVWFRILSTHLESLTLEHQPIGVRLSVEAAGAAGRQLHLFESALRDPNKFGETLAQLKALVGDGEVGVPRPANTHRPDAFVIEEFSEVTDAGTPGRQYGLPLRRDRRPIGVKLSQGRPMWLEKLGPVADSAGPYCLSGDWWDAQPWMTEEWDVEMVSGDLLRISKDATGRWRLEGAYEVC